MKLDIRNLAAFKATLNSQRCVLAEKLVLLAEDVLDMSDVSSCATSKLALNALDSQFYDAIVWLEMYGYAEDIVAFNDNPTLADVVRALEHAAVGAYAIKTASAGRVAGPADAFHRLFAALRTLEECDARIVEICKEVDADEDIDDSYDEFKNGNKAVIMEVHRRQMVKFLNGRDPNTLPADVLEKVRAAATSMGLDLAAFGLKSGAERGGVQSDDDATIDRALALARSLGYDVERSHIRCIGDGKTAIHLSDDGRSTDKVHSLDEDGLATLRATQLDGGTADHIPGEETSGEKTSGEETSGAPASRRSYFPERMARPTMEDILSKLVGPEGRATDLGARVAI